MLILALLSVKVSLLRQSSGVSPLLKTFYFKGFDAAALRIK